MWHGSRKEGRHVEHVDGDALVGELVQLARRELSGDPPRSAVRALPDLRRRPTPSFWQQRRWAAGLAAAAALCAVLGFLLVARPARPITYTVENGAVVEGAVLAAAGGPSTRVQFSEGSAVWLEGGAETSIGDLNANGGTLRVRTGTARVAIAHRPGAAWTVQAGPYAVRVTGTEFDVGWNDSERRLEVTLRSGSVEVAGAALSTPIRLRAGQRLLVRGAEAPQLVDVGVEPKLPTVPTVPPAVASSESEELPAVSAAGSRSPAESKLRASDTPWSRRVAQGKFDEVLAEAESRGLDQVIGRASLSDLTALADAARYARRGPLAERALKAQRERFRSSGAARDAAFLLGQLAESRGQSALAWYDTYLSETPSGTYAPQALGRKMMIAYRESGASTAAAIANQYLVRYPKGPYAAAARKIVSESSPRSPH
jgi:hypothetical protein